jgi:hypothetical protein
MTPASCLSLIPTHHRPSVVAGNTPALTRVGPGVREMVVLPGYQWPPRRCRRLTLGSGTLLGGLRRSQSENDIGASVFAFLWRINRWILLRDPSHHELQPGRHLPGLNALVSACRELWQCNCRWNQPAIREPRGSRHRGGLGGRGRWAWRGPERSRSPDVGGRHPSPKPRPRAHRTGAPYAPVAVEAATTVFM